MAISKTVLWIPQFKRIENMYQKYLFEGAMTAVVSCLPNEKSEALVERLVHTFYSRVRTDALLGPIFEQSVGHRWKAHLSAMIDFWSSIALMSGRYAGKPHLAHSPLGLAPEHFQRWLELFEQTVGEVCQGRAAVFFIDRAHRIADSLQIGLNIGPKAVQLPPRNMPAPV